MVKEIEYQKHYLSLNRAELIARLERALKPSRFKHVLRVEQTAIKLAKQYDVDLEAASVAGLCHDYAKQRPDEDFITVIKAKKLSKELLDYGNAIWHGVVGSWFGAVCQRAVIVTVMTRIVVPLR